MQRWSGTATIGICVLAAVSLTAIPAAAATRASRHHVATATRASRHHAATATPAFVAPPTCTDSWTGAGNDGLWLTPANWSSGLPSSSDAVCITMSGSFSVVLTPTSQAPATSYTVGSLQVGAAGDTGTQGLQLVSKSCDAAGLDVTATNGAWIEASGELDLSWTSSGLCQSGESSTVSVPTSAQISNAGTIALGADNSIIDGNLVNDGSVEVNGGASSKSIEKFATNGTTFDNNGKVDVAAGAYLDVSGGATFSDNSAGTVTATSGSATTTSVGDDVVIENGGTFDAAGGVTTNNPVLVLGGALNITSASDHSRVLMEEASDTTQPTITGDIAANDTVVMQGESCLGPGINVDATGSFSNAGTLTLTWVQTGQCAPGESSRLTLPSGDTLTNTGTLNLSAHNAAITGNIDNPGTVAVAGSSNNSNALYDGSGTTFDNTGVVTIAADIDLMVENGAAFDNDAGGSVTATSGSPTASAAGDDLVVEEGSTYQQGGGTTSNNPVLIIGGALKTTSQSGTSSELLEEATDTTQPTIDGTIGSHQTVTLQGESCLGPGVNAITSGDLVNNGTIVITWIQTGQCTPGESATLTVPGGSTLTNHGTIKLKADTATISGEIDNSGTLEVDGGAFSGAEDIDGDIDNSGTLALATGSKLTVTGNVTEESNGTMSLFIAAAPPGSPFLTITGTANLDGTLDVETSASYTSLAQGQAYKLLTDTAQTGSFSSSSVLPAPAGFTYAVITGAHAVNVDVAGQGGSLTHPVTLDGSATIQVGQSGQVPVTISASDYSNIIGVHSVYSWDPSGLTIATPSVPTGWSDETHAGLPNGSGGFFTTTATNPDSVGATVLTLPVTCHKVGNWPIAFEGQYFLPSASAGYTDDVEGTVTVTCSAPPASATTASAGVTLDPSNENVSLSVTGQGLAGATTAKLVTSGDTVVSTSSSIDAAATVVSAQFPPTPPGNYDVELDNGSGPITTTTGEAFAVPPALPFFSVAPVDDQGVVQGIANTQLFDIGNLGSADGVAIMCFTFPAYLSQEPIFNIGSAPAGSQLLLHGQTVDGWVEYVAVPVSAGSNVDIAWTYTVPPSATIGSDPFVSLGQPITVAPTFEGAYTSVEWSSVSSDSDKDIVDGAMAQGMNDYDATLNDLYAMTDDQAAAYLSGLAYPDLANALVFSGQFLLDGLTDTQIQAAGVQATEPAPIDEPVLAADPVSISRAPADESRRPDLAGKPVPVSSSISNLPRPPKAGTTQPSNAMNDPAATSFANFSFNTAQAESASYGLDNKYATSSNKGLAASITYGSTQPATVIAGAQTTFEDGSVAPLSYSQPASGTLPAIMSSSYVAQWQPTTVGAPASTFAQNLNQAVTLNVAGAAAASNVMPFLEQESTSVQQSIQHVSQLKANLMSSAAKKTNIFSARSAGVHPDNTPPPENDNQMMANYDTSGRFFTQGLPALFAAKDTADGAESVAGDISEGNGIGLLKDLPGFIGNINQLKKLVGAVDPNDITVTPAGVGSQGWITPQPLAWTIDFQNEPTATADATNVVVTAHLDGDLDPTTVAPGPSSFANTQFSFDPSSRTLQWVLPNIDLPPDTDPPNGEASVSFSADPASGLANGSQITEHASVVFDYNQPIVTPTVTNTIDTLAPTISIAHLSATQRPGEIPVTWSSPSPVGVSWYDVYVEADGGKLKLAGRTVRPELIVDALAGHSYGVAVVATDDAGITAAKPAKPQVTFTANEPAKVVGRGYWLALRNGKVIAAGNAKSFKHARTHSPVVGITATPNGKGYWLAQRNGTVITAGNAKTLKHARTHSPVVAITATPNDKGYWLAQRNGTVITAGNAKAFKHARTQSPVVAITATPNGKGYWLAQRNGTVITAGNAKTLKHAHTTSPVVGITATPNGKGYWLAQRNGKVVPAGTALSLTLAKLKHPVGAIATTLDGNGFWLAETTGSVVEAGDALAYAHRAGGSPVVGIAVRH